MWVFISVLTVPILDLKDLPTENSVTIILSQYFSAKYLADTETAN